MLTPEQIRERHTGIGGSDAAPVCGANIDGVDVYSTPTEVYLSKIDEDYKPDLSGNEPVAHGNAFEEAIAGILAKRLGIEVFKPERTLRHPDHPWMLANPDRLIVGENKGVEIKNRSFFMRSSYGTPGSDEVLGSDMFQCQHYMAVTSYPAWDLWVCFGGQQSVPFHIRRNDKFIASMMKLESHFWHHNVLTETPPPPQTIGDIGLLFKSEEGVRLTADEVMTRKIIQLQKLKTQEKQIKSRFEALKKDLCLDMKTAAAIVDERGQTLVTWKTTEDRKTFDVSGFKKAHPDLYSVHLIAQKGSRRFLLKGEAE